MPSMILMVRVCGVIDVAAEVNDTEILILISDSEKKGLVDNRTTSW